MREVSEAERLSEEAADRCILNKSDSYMLRRALNRVFTRDHIDETGDVLDAALAARLAQRGRFAAEYYSLLLAWHQQMYGSGSAMSGAAVEEIALNAADRLRIPGYRSIEQAKFSAAVLSSIRETQPTTLDDPLFASNLRKRCENFTTPAQADQMLSPYWRQLGHEEEPPLPSTSEMPHSPGSEAKAHQEHPRDAAPAVDTATGNFADFLAAVNQLLRVNTGYETTLGWRIIAQAIHARIGIIADPAALQPTEKTLHNALGRQLLRRLPATHGIMARNQVSEVLFWASSEHALTITSAQIGSWPPASMLSLSLVKTRRVSLTGSERLPTVALQLAAAVKAIREQQSGIDLVLADESEQVHIEEGTRQRVQAHKVREHLRHLASGEVVVVHEHTRGSGDVRETERIYRVPRKD